MGFGGTGKGLRTGQDNEPRAEAQRKGQGKGARAMSAEGQGGISMGNAGGDLQQSRGRRSRTKRTITRALDPAVEERRRRRSDGWETPQPAPLEVRPGSHRWRQMQMHSANQERMAAEIREGQQALERALARLHDCVSAGAALPAPVFRVASRSRSRSERRARPSHYRAASRTDPYLSFSDEQLEEYLEEYLPEATAPAGSAPVLVPTEAAAPAASPAAPAPAEAPAPAWSAPATVPTEAAAPAAGAAVSVPAEAAVPAAGAAAPAPVAAAPWIWTFGWERGPLPAEPRGPLPNEAPGAEASRVPTGPEARLTERDGESDLTEGSPSEVPTDTALVQREFAARAAMRAAAALPWAEALVDALKQTLLMQPA